MQNDKLLPCPFCGGEARTYQSRYKKNGVEGRNWFAICNNCKINYPATLDKIAMTEDEAIELWNTRKPMERIVERLKEESYFEEPKFNIAGYCDDYIEEVVCLDKAIEIVKGGVDNEN